MEKQTHELAAYYYIIVDKQGKMCAQKIEIHDGNSNNNLAERMLNNILEDYNSLNDEFKKTWNDKAELTLEETLRHERAEKCEFCSKEFVPGLVKKIKHHRWDTKVEYDSKGHVLKSNYVATLCCFCNLRITLKYRYLPTFAHNGGKFDSKFLIDGFNNAKFRDIDILKKSGENFMSITMKPKNKKQYGMKFLDSLNYFSMPLSKMAVSLRSSNHDFKFMKKTLSDMGYTDSLIDKLFQKGVFPYEYLDDFAKLKECQLPEKRHFYSSLTESTVTDSEYEFALDVFKSANCSNLKDYLTLYLITDVLLLTEYIMTVRISMYNVHKLDITSFVTAPSYAIQSALLNSKASIQLITDTEVYAKFEENIRGGFACANIGRVKCNTPNTQSFDKQQPITYHCRNA